MDRYLCVRGRPVGRTFTSACARALSNLQLDGWGLKG